VELEDQVCSFELAKRLKELGVKQDAYFTWCSSSKGYHLLAPFQFNNFREDDYSAFSVAELGEMLRDHLNEYNFTFYGVDGNWVINVYEDTLELVAKTEADARAKMLIYLIENKKFNP